MRRLRSFTSFYLLLAGVLLAGTSLLHGQAVSFLSGTANFGSLNVCAPGGSVPAPCNATETLTYKVTAGGVLGTPKVLTSGAPNLDFTLAGGTCSGSVTTGSTCTVQAKFAPRYAGARAGAVEIVDESGKLLATTFVQGMGLGAQIAFDGPTGKVLFDTPGQNIGWLDVAVDGLGNVFFLGLTGSPSAVVYEQPADGGPTTTVSVGISSPAGIAVDGAGTLYIADATNNVIVEVPPGCKASSCRMSLSAGFSTPTAVVVDADGTVYVVDYVTGGNRLLKVPVGCASSTCVVILASGIYNFGGPLALDHAGNLLFVADSGSSFDRISVNGGPITLAVLDAGNVTGIAVDAAGNIFLADTYNFRITKVPPGCTLESSCGTILASNFGTPTGLALDGAGDLFRLNYYSYGQGVLVEFPRGQPPPYIFASTNVDAVSSDSPQVYTVSNGGNQTLSLAGVSVGPVPSFVQSAGPGTPADCHAGTVLAGVSSCDLSITFSPTSGEPLTGAATLMDNSLGVSGGVQTIPLAGLGLVPGTPIGFPNGFGGTAPTFFSLNGGTTLDGTALELTDGGQFEERSAFFLKRVGVTSFQTSFDFKLTGKGKPAPDADGFTFVLQGNGQNAIGSGGSGLGYGPPALGVSGPAITNSVAIKFDLHNNNGEGQSSTGLYINGASPTVPAVNLLPSSIDLHSGHSFHVTLAYVGTTLTLTIKDLTTNATFSHAFTVDIPGAVGGSTAYAGFTASTGATTAVQEILNWQFTATECCNANEPQFASGFGDFSTMNLNNATPNGTAMQLVNGYPNMAGSAYFSTMVPVNKFTSDFDFQLSAGNGDGFTFLVQTENPYAVGPPGGGLGYGPEKPGAPSHPNLPITNSVAVKFDLHNNAGEGVDSTGIYTNGASPSVPSTDLTASRINFHLGHTFHGRLSYDGTNLKMTITDLTDYDVFAVSYPVDIPTAVGGMNAFAGFTAGTGNSVDIITILNWEMSSY